MCLMPSVATESLSALGPGFEQLMANRWKVFGWQIALAVRSLVNVLTLFLGVSEYSIPKYIHKKI